MKKVKKNNLIYMLLLVLSVFLTSCSVPKPENTITELETAINSAEVEKIIEYIELDDDITEEMVESGVNEYQSYLTNMAEELKALQEFGQWFGPDNEFSKINFKDVKLKLKLLETYPKEISSKDKIILAKLSVDMVVMDSEENEKSLLTLAKLFGVEEMDDTVTGVIGMRREKGKWLVSASAYDEFESQTVEDFSNKSVEVESE